MEARSKEKHSKIRKRGNSSSSSSSLVHKYRFKRAILVGKRGASNTAVPFWMTSNKSPTLAMPNAESNKSGSGGNKTKEASVSARKLAATLWEINKVPSTGVEKDLELAEDKKEVTRSKDKVAKLQPHLLDPSYTPVSERMDRSRGNGGHMRRVSVVSKKLHLTDYNLRSLDSVSNAGFMEIDSHTRGRTHLECVIGIRTRLKDVSNGLTASKELLKVLNRLWGLDEQHPSGVSLVSALRVELDRARLQVNQLIKEQRSSRNEIECLVRHFEEEKAAWKSKERERIRNAIACIAEELEVEKKLRRQTERLNKKLGKELADTKTSLSNALKELESEKRAKEILEQVCDELARGIGEDRAEVEELKRESAKVREEVEREREMLQLADVWREERVQMKLSEAKYQFEEKHAAVERLRNELEVYLRTKVGKEDGEGSPNYERIKELEAYLKEIQFGSEHMAERQEVEGEAMNGEVHDGDESADSDLHSIELNMDDISKCYQWNFACDGIALDVPRRVSVDRCFKGRKSISENIEWGSISLTRRKSNASNDRNDRDLIGKIKENPDMPDDAERVSELSQTLEHEDEINRYRSAMSLKDHILSGSKKALTQNFAGPTGQWGQSLPFQDAGSAVSEGSPVSEGNNIKHRIPGTRSEHRTSASSRH